MRYAKDDEALMELQSHALLLAKLEGWVIEFKAIEKMKNLRMNGMGLHLTSEGEYHHASNQHTLKMVLDKIQELKKSVKSGDYRIRRSRRAKTH